MSDIDSGHHSGSSLPRLSVIVPVASEETQWPALLRDLSEQLPVEAEVILAAIEAVPDDFKDTASTYRFDPLWVQGRPGRARQMNDAAVTATGDFLWFLHADSRLLTEATRLLLASVQQHPHSLHYFRLRFSDGPRWLRLNELGVLLRCRLLGLPFGDQGFCLRRDVFITLNGFDEDVRYGEDHLFVWKARRRGVRLHEVSSAIATSGRKYAERGWLSTTLRHLWLTARQAVPELLRFRRKDAS